MLQMKKYLWFFGVMLLALGLVACSSDDATDTEANDSEVAGNSDASNSSSSDSGEIQEVKAKLAHFYSPDIFTYQGYEHFAKLVNEKSDGKITFTIYPAGQLYNDANLPTAISTGQVEIGATVVETWASNLPAMEFNTLPIYDGQEHFRSVVNGGLREIVDGQLATLNVKPLIWTYFDFSFFASNDKALTKPEDFVGKDIRTTGPLMSKFVELSGGTPVTIPAVEVPQALQRGTVDASVSGVAAFQSWKYYDYTEYYSGPFNPGLVLLSANTKWWNSLNEATQNVILEAAKEAEDYLVELHDKVNTEARELLAEEGMKFEEVQLKDFESAINQLKEEYLERSGDVGQEIVDLVESKR